jgi:chaperonin GroEL (HSP60 family)
MKMGMFVTTNVERTAVQNAASISGLLLTTNAIVREIKRKNWNPPARRRVE